MTSALKLSALATPEVIEELSFEAILTALMADVQSRFDAAVIAYDVGNLETDPIKIVLEAAAYREVVLRARANDAARANLLAFAGSTDLDHLAAFYGLTRLSGESDLALRERVLLAIVGRSAAGPEERYEAVARSVDARIVDAHIYQVDGGPALHCVLLTSDNGGVPDAPLQAAVLAALTADDVRSINDVITVGAAVSTVVNIVADVWLRPEASQQIITDLPTSIKAAWAVTARIGDDLALSWINSRLHVDGVSRVEVTAPADSVIATDEEAIGIGTVTINYKGRTR
jgi:phage-related baseplate assembly protein